MTYAYIVLAPTVKGHFLRWLHKEACERDICELWTVGWIASQISRDGALANSHDLIYQINFWEKSIENKMADSDT